MTPAIKLLEKNQVTFRIHSYQHDASAPSYGLEAAEALNLPASQVFKTLLVSPPGGKPKDLVVAIVPVNAQLDLKALANTLKLKKLEMAKPNMAQATTGYLLGGISPLGQKKQLTTIIDASAQEWDTLYCSGGKRGLEIELAPQDLLSLCRARYAQIARSE